MGAPILPLRTSRGALGRAKLVLPRRESATQVPLAAADGQPRLSLDAGRGGDADPRAARRRHRLVHGVQRRLLRRRAGAGRESSAAPSPTATAPTASTARTTSRPWPPRWPRWPGWGCSSRRWSGWGCRCPPTWKLTLYFSCIGMFGDRRRHALHADPGRPPAARVPVGARGRQHPARADRPASAQAIDRQAGRRARWRGWSFRSSSRRVARSWRRSGRRRRRSGPG